MRRRRTRVALAFDRPLVVGGRGTGKSYWAAALCEPEARDRLVSLYPRARRSLQDTRSFQGFVGRLGAENAPFAATAGELLELVEHAPPDHVWRAVLCRYLADRPEDTLAEIYDSGTTRDRAFRDRLVEIGGARVMMVCDALDRLSPSWASGRRLCRGLLQLALDLRGFRQANVKVFLRRDQFEDAGLFNFPDASKLRTGAVELDWEHDELYGLLFQGVQAELPEDVWQQRLAPLMPESEDQGSEPYRRAFEHVAGEFMGTDCRRGFTYTWIPKHLADTSHRASPRSFIVAIGRAAESAAPNTATPIDYRGIHEGVRAASRDPHGRAARRPSLDHYGAERSGGACSALPARAVHAPVARQGNPEAGARCRRGQRESRSADRSGKRHIGDGRAGVARCAGHVAGRRDTQDHEPGQRTRHLSRRRQDRPSRRNQGCGAEAACGESHADAGARARCVDFVLALRTRRRARSADS